MEKCRAESVNIGPVIEGLSRNRLFGGHVVRGSDDLAGLILLGERIAGEVEEPGNADVQDLHDTIAAKEEITRSDVAMNQFPRVCMLKAGRGLDQVTARVPHRQHPARLVEKFREVLPVEVFHDQEVRVLLASHVECERCSGG